VEKPNNHEFQTAVPPLLIAIPLSQVNLLSH
jgi:hypothetical protein